MTSPIELLDDPAGKLSVLAIAFSAVGWIGVAIKDVVVTVIKHRRMGGMTWNDFVDRYEKFSQTIVELRTCVDNMNYAKFSESVTRLDAAVGNIDDCMIEIKTEINHWHNRASEIEGRLMVLEDRGIRKQ